MFSSNCSDLDLRSRISASERQNGFDAEESNVLYHGNSIRAQRSQNQILPHLRKELGFPPFESIRTLGPKIH